MRKLIANAMPFAAALVLLAGCSKSSESTGADEHAGHEHPTAPRDPNRLWCKEHATYEDICFICHPEMRDQGRLWCEEHGRYEDRCWPCHPELQDKSRAWCGKHFLYVDECFLCRPELKTKGAPAAGPTGAQTLMCNEHGVLEAECGICRPQTVAQLAPGQGLKVRLPAAESAALAGIETSKPHVGATAETIECYAELAFNQNQFAQIVAPVAGIIQEVATDLGDKVGENQVVAKIWSASIAETVARAVLTHQTLERERRLRAERVTSQRDLQEAEAAHRAACQQARTFGFSEEDIDAMGAKPDEPVYLPVRAPFAGEIVERAAVRGALVDAGKSLFTLADRSTMWAMLNIPEVALARVRPGQSVELRVEALPGQTFIGKLTWIAAAVDERTRMARARAEVPNPDGLLRDKMFAQARILARTTERAVLLPASALQIVDGHPLVFVRLGEDLFEARSVRIGAKHNGHLEVLDGLKPDEPVAVARSFALKSQLLLSRLGAGCVDD